MSIWAAPKSPMIFPLRVLDWQVVNGCKPESHQTVVIEFPVLIAVGAEPISAIIVPFVSEPHSDAVFVESPKLFDQPVVEFFGPLPFQKLNDLGPTRWEFGAVS